MTKVSWKSTFAELTILRLSHHLWVLQFWWSTLKLDRNERLSSKYRELERLPLYARVFVKTANVVISRCCFLQRTTRSYSKKRAASAARLFFTIRLIKFLNCDAFTPCAVVAAKMNKNKRFACTSRAFFFYFWTFLSRSLQICVVKWPFLTFYRERGQTGANLYFFPSLDTSPLEPVSVHTSPLF